MRNLFTTLEIRGKTLVGKAHSNLGFVDDMDVSIVINENGDGIMQIGTFETGIMFKKMSGNDGDILIYRYPSQYAASNANYLHLRLMNKEIIGQTVMSGLYPGGSTFKLTIIDDIEEV